MYDGLKNERYVMSTVTIASEFVKISHYGCGRGRLSPVLLTLPKRVTEKQERLVVTHEFALAFREVYDDATNAQKLSHLKQSVADLRRSFARGAFGRAEANMIDCIRLWQRENLASMHDFSRLTQEEKDQDKVGYVLAAVDSTNDRYDYEEYYAGVHAVELVTPKAVFYGTVIIMLALAAAITLVLTTQDYATMLFASFILFFFRYKQRFLSLKPDATAFDYYALKAFPGSTPDGYDVESMRKPRLAFVRTLATEKDRAKIVRIIVEAQRTERLTAESEKLRKAIPSQIFKEITALPEKNEAVHNLWQEAAAFADDDLIDWPELRAQRALLEEVKKLPYS